MPGGNIFVPVIADYRRLGNFNPGVYNGTTQARIASNLATGEQNRIRHLAVGINADAGRQYTSNDTPAANDATRRNNRVHRDTHAPAFLREDEFGGRLLRHERAHWPIGVVKIELGSHVHQVEICLVIRLDRADIAPVVGALSIEIVKVIS